MIKNLQHHQQLSVSSVTQAVYSIPNSNISKKAGILNLFLRYDQHRVQGVPAVNLGGFLNYHAPNLHLRYHQLGFPFVLAFGLLVALHSGEMAFKNLLKAIYEKK